MARLIDDLIMLSWVTRSELRRQVVDLSTLARSIVARLEHMQPDRRVEVVIADRVGAECDATLLDVVLENLFGNAWKSRRSARAPGSNSEFRLLLLHPCSSSAITAQDLTWRPRTSSLACFNACIPSTSSREQVLAWPPCSGLFADMVDAYGRKRQWIKA